VPKHYILSSGKPITQTLIYVSGPDGHTVPSTTYRCSSCFEQTLTRVYDVSHLSIRCPNCGEFARFVHEGVLEQYEALEESPPEEFDWERLDRMEKFVVAEKLVRQGNTLDDFEVEVHDGE